MRINTKRIAPLNKLQVQMLLTALLPVLLVSTLLTWPVIELRRTQIMEQAKLRMLQAGRSSELLIAERLGFAQLLIGLLADRLILASMLEASDLTGLEGFTTKTLESTLFDTVIVLNATGSINIQSGDSGLIEQNKRSIDRTFISGNTAKGMVIQVQAPIMRNERQIGMLIGAFVIGEPFLEATRRDSGLQRSLFIGEKLVASTLPIRQAVGNNWLVPFDPTRASEEFAPEQEVVIDHTSYLVYYHLLHDHEDNLIGSLEILLPLGAVKAAQEQTTITIVGGVLLAIAVAMLLSWLLAQRMTKAIRSLGLAAQRIGAGNFGQPVMVQGANEIGSLSSAIDQMRRQLQGTHQALSTETARYLNILESSRDAILVLDASGRVAMLNQSAEVLLGRPRTLVIGQSMARLVALHGGEPLLPEHIPLVGNIHLAIETVNGQIRTVEATRTAIQPNAQARDEHIVVLRDVSDAVALNALKDAFLANVTHEFRTPLSSLIASLEILRNEHGFLSPAEQQQMLAAVHIGVYRLDTLVQNLLDSASIHAGYFRVEPEATRLEPLIDEALEVMMPLVQQRAQVIRVTIIPHLPTVLADDRRIVQVLVNLLSNASKFGPRGDTILLNAMVVEHYVEVVITDHGPGIPLSRQSSLFERFLRPGSETMDAQGAGLGLAIVKAIVERHGGTIQVSTENEHGTTFRFSLQIADVSMQTVQQVDHEHTSR
jgi:PAS domain S-box-containing protein